MDLEFSLNAFLETLSGLYCAELCTYSAPESVTLRKATRDAKMLVFDNNIAALNAVLTQVSSSITSLAVSVRYARNSMCGVNRLPFDIMHTIFYFATQLAREPFTEDLDGNNLGPHCQALRLSQVCSHWRATTLEQRTLWSYLDVTKMSKSCLQLFQQRSRGCPLTVVCPVWYKTRWESFWEDPTVRSRIKTLELSLPPAGAHSRAHSLYGTSSAPLLEELHLSNYGAPMPLPHVFPTGAPRLRELHVNGFGIERWSGCYRNLTTLCLTDTRLSYQLPEQHLDDVLQMISDSPNLERLEYALLAYAREPSARPPEDNLWSTEPSSATSPVPPRIALNHLTKCRLIMPTSKLAAYLLEQITYTRTLRHLSLDVWGVCDVADLLRPEVIPSWLLQQFRESLVDSSLKHYETYHLTSYFALVERSEIGALNGSFLLGWSSERPLYDEIGDIAVALEGNYPVLPIYTQSIKFGPLTPKASLTDLCLPLVSTLLLPSTTVKTLRFFLDDTFLPEGLPQTTIDKSGSDNLACSQFAADAARWVDLAELEIINGPQRFPGLTVAFEERMYPLIE